MKHAGAILGLIVLVSAGCGGQSKEAKVCRSIHENPALFDKVLIGGQPAINFPERTFTPVSLVTKRLGKPVESSRIPDHPSPPGEGSGPDCARRWFLAWSGDFDASRRLRVGD